MLLIRTTVGPSRIHGLGLFAAEDVAAGTVVWHLDLDVDEEFTAEEAAALRGIKLVSLDYFGYVSQGGKYVMPGDDAVYMNHSDNPSLVAPKSGAEEDVAAHDIHEGDELTNNYRRLANHETLDFLPMDGVPTCA